MPILTQFAQLLTMYRSKAEDRNSQNWEIMVDPKESSFTIIMVGHRIWIQHLATEINWQKA